MTTETPLCYKEIDHAFPIAPQVYSYLRARIVDNRLPPGAKISEASVADSLNSYTSDVHLIAGSVVVCESAHPHTTQSRHSPCSQVCTIQTLVQHIALQERA